MNVWINPEFVEVEAQHFHDITYNLNLTRDAYGDGENIYLNFPFNTRRIAVHLVQGDRYFVDPKFFKRKTSE